MYRFATSLLASAVIVFLGTTLLGTTLSERSAQAQPQIIATVVAHAQPTIIATVVAHAHPTNWVAVHGL